MYRGDSTDAERSALLLLAERAATQMATGIVFDRPAEHVRRVTPDPVQLYRYSAVTFNGHRIHYDAPYAVNVEMYPGLVVHGTLIATMLLEFLLDSVCPAQSVLHFEFRAKRPTFDIADFHLHAGTQDADGRIALWSSNNIGEVAVDGWAVCA